MTAATQSGAAALQCGGDDILQYGWWCLRYKCAGGAGRYCHLRGLMLVPSPRCAPTNINKYNTLRWPGLLASILQIITFRVQGKIINELPKCDKKGA